MIPETGMKKPIEGSFNAVVNEIIQIRRANPYLTEKFGWRTDVAGVEHELEAYTVARCLAHGWTDWVIMDDAFTEAPPEKKTPKWAGAAVGSVKRVAAGIAILLDWLGDGAKPVDPPLAEKRAGVCVACPKNDLKGDWKSYFTAPVAEKIRVQLEMKSDLRLRTSQDSKLGICTACDCPLPLKLHAPLSHILAHTSADTKKRLDKGCWILSEAK